MKGTTRAEESEEARLGDSSGHLLDCSAMCINMSVQGQWVSHGWLVSGLGYILCIFLRL